MTEEPTPPHADGYVPFQIDFDKLAADIRGFSGEGALPEALHGLVDDALRHVRDETAEVDENVVGRVLMTAAVLVQSLEDAYSGWNGRMIANLLGVLGQRLWDSAPQQFQPTLPPDGKPAADGDYLIATFEPITESRAQELRGAVEQVRR